jgi:conserved oligomeric Golgi complex subunit 5
MFPDNVAIDDSGIPISSGLSLLPSKYDVQRFDENIRQELSLADPREGGGDLTMVSMIAGCVTEMIAQFCSRAKNAVSGIINEDSYLNDDWSLTESLQHDRKMAAIMFTMATYLRSAPEKTFIAPYRPATLPQHEEAAEMCRVALTPALNCIEEMVQSVILRPLCRAVNRRVAATMAKMHLGVYMKSSGGGGGSMEEDDSPAFVQKYLAPVYEEIAQKILPKFPPKYAVSIAASVAAFSIYTFVSNAALVRPLAESARLHITQDLADLELSLEQLVMKGGGGVVLSQIDKGKPYAELRAVRQMLFWSGLESQNREAVELAKSLLREVWIKDVRPSTVIHYLFSFAPSLLSSPHHAKRIKAEDYVMTLVQLDGSAQHGEDTAWMVTMSCCDMYQQRASSSMTSLSDGDARIAQILLALGPELLRRRRS